MFLPPPQIFPAKPAVDVASTWAVRALWVVRSTHKPVRNELVRDPSLRWWHAPWSRGLEWMDSVAFGESVGILDDCTSKILRVSWFLGRSRKFFWVVFEVYGFMYEMALLRPWRDDQQWSGGGRRWMQMKCCETHLHRRWDGAGYFLDHPRYAFQWSCIGVDSGCFCCCFQVSSNRHESGRNHCF